MPIPSGSVLPSPLLLPGSTGGVAGAYTHSFPAVRPSARFDGNAWVTVTVAQSSTRTGTFTDLVSDFTLDPADTDPTDPQTRDVTVTGATLAAGWYRFTFTDDSGETEVFDPIYAGPGVRPTVAEVAALMPDRTTIDGGSEARTFTEATSPTASEVAGLIDMVLDSVEPRVPASAVPKVIRAARHVVTLNTAILVESGNWGDQIETNEARVALWERLLGAHEATLDAAANDDLAGSSRFGSITVTSPTLTAWNGQMGLTPSTETIP